jgi:hypothetical protein
MSMSNWKKIYTKYNGRCWQCKAILGEGSRAYWLPLEHSASKEPVILCPDCYMPGVVEKYEAASISPESSPEPTGKKKEITLKELMGGVMKPSKKHDDGVDADALDRLMNDAFEDQKEKPVAPDKVEKYTLAWFASGAKWKLC